MKYNLNSWVKRNIDKDFIDILFQADEDYMYSKKFGSHKSVKNLPKYWKFRNGLNGFLFFMHNKRKSSVGSLEPFMPIINNWIRRKIIDKKSLLLSEGLLALSFFID